MPNTTAEPMDASQQFCPNLACSARGQIGQGNISIHDRQRQRSRWKLCKQTCSARRGTLLEGLRKPTELLVLVVTFLAYGCPIQAIVQAFGLDERTLASWRERAGGHCQQRHQALVLQGQLDAHHVQVDEIRVKGRGMIVWMGLALLVSTRLWLGGVGSVHRDRRLADRLVHQLRACCRPVQAILVCTAGWSAYPGSIQRAVRAKVKRSAGRGRACLQVWSGLCIATVLKRTEKKRVVEVIGKMTRGTLEQACLLLQASLGGSVLKTADIERFNGTMRERLAALTRKWRHAAQRLQALEPGMDLIGCTYNWCFPHHELSPSKHAGFPCTPALAAGLTDHIWSVREVLTYKVAPAPWVQPKRRGRPRKHPLPDPTVPKRPHGRPRKVA